MARATLNRSRTANDGATRTAAPPALPGQVVLVLQGGGALGAYQVGVYQALHEAGIEPDWVVGTSIGAINAALIAGAPPAERLDRLGDFWKRVEHGRFMGAPLPNWFTQAARNMLAVTSGVSAVFPPQPPPVLSSPAPPPPPGRRPHFLPPPRLEASAIDSHR